MRRAPVVWLCSLMDVLDRRLLRCRFYDCVLCRTYYWLFERAYHR